ncbi:CGNR zinc finger domain-containing protein [Catenuloplanes atrovinosus]|uniref:RNA-binding Zn ribbon-like protein n=1 Tax=Catenuloplanes atrovinosus TaxID=137266 RepID=A0AAE3YSA9_9ACTN|nr:CGNR zinc finger domain-containing protein [Catenuloplanes atrovinosus]MDR7279053.1 putative RNA-binding Zn ribbon-like protein [Catenuloplanes atrovinosus]
MHINPYGEDAVLLAIDLLRHPPATAAELEARCRAADLMIEQPVTAADLDATRDFLRTWLGVVDAPDFTTRADRLNALLAGSSAHPRLTNHAGDGWHVHYRGSDLPLGWLLRALISVGTALHLAGRGMHRLGRCAEPTCAAPFADVSRTGRQRYCSTTCANRDAVRRHRARTTAA